MANEVENSIKTFGTIQKTDLQKKGVVLELNTND